MLEAIRTFILTYPKLDELARLGIDFLPSEPTNYSISRVPVRSVIREFIDGSSERQLVFNFDSRMTYSEEFRNNIENSTFFEEFQDWLEEQSFKNNLPQLKKGLIATEIEALSDGYIFSTPETMDSAIYRVQCRLIYEKEAR